MTISDEAPHWIVQAYRKTVGWVQDHPHWMSLILAGVVVLHAVSTLKWASLSPYVFLTGPSDPQVSIAVAIFAGTAGAAALVAGFAGVVLIFTIGATSPRLRTFRHRGGGSLRRNWIAVVTEPFIATLLGLTAAVTATTAGRGVAPWLFELAVVLLVHAAARLIWILRELVEIVAVDDRIENLKEREIPLDQLFPQ